ncbi:twin-arginine translocation signal domain-containing protein [Mesorhizobium microcysteis]|uniref:Twin-arginine translocation signal domain-containing protein n=1 Tax=Neoaquamicrobium microcysteis TaxID=2682781 RepID=A0A5D4GRH2_9HYPH|nr:tripartite tricarboxylate transporter substrate-binding protein [Mesorhizobium microcysteis]TYR30744.1 twin-arginine translocation signal domain-containing protein [Mesorhizobium microcysteis]
MHSKVSRRNVLKATAGGVAMAALGMPSILRAQDGFPNRPINVIVPFDTGGYNDRLARAFAPFLQEALGQPLTIINRGGAGALLGHTFFLQQPDDGYTILCTSAAPYLPLNILTQDASFALEDFYMVNLPSQDYTLLATSSGSDIQTIDDVIARLKEDPGSLSVGLQPASADLVNFSILCEANDIDMEAVRIVTYDGGGPARNAVAGGVVDIGLVGGEGFLPLAEQIRPLLTFDVRQRDGWEGALVNEVLGEDPDFVVGSQRGWGLHASMQESNPEVFSTLVEAIETASKNPAAIEALKNQQLATDWYGPEESNQMLARTATVMEQYIDLLQGT